MTYPLKDYYNSPEAKAETMKQTAIAVILLAAVVGTLILFAHTWPQRYDNPQETGKEEAMRH